MAIADTLGIPSNLRRIYLPFTPKNNPGFFTFKQGSFGNANIITPFSKNLPYLIAMDSGISLTHEQNQGKLELQRLLNFIPALQIREYMPDAKLTQLFKWMDAFRAGFKSGKEAANEVNSASKFLDELVKDASAIRDQLTDKFLKLTTDSALGLQTIAGGIGPTNFKDMNFPVGKDAGYAVLYVPFLLYYRLNTTSTTNVYEIPFDINTSHNELMHSDGTYGWNGGDWFSAGQIGLKSQSSFSKILGLNTLKTNIMPSFSPDGIAKGLTFNIEFTLINDTAEGAANNYIMLHNLFGNNRWLQYGFVQTSSSLYDVKIPGANRYMMCNGQFKCTAVGGFRTPSNQICNYIVGSMSNSKGGVKGKDWYPNARTALEEQSQSSDEVGDAASDALNQVAKAQIEKDQLEVAEQAAEAERQFIEDSGQSQAEINEMSSNISELEGNIDEAEKTAATELQTAQEEGASAIAEAEANAEAAQNEFSEATAAANAAQEELEAASQAHQAATENLTEVANNTEASRELLSQIDADHGDMESIVNNDPELKSLKQEYDRVYNDPNSSTEECAAAEAAFNSKLNETMNPYLPEGSKNYTELVQDRNNYNLANEEHTKATSDLMQAEFKSQEAEARLEAANSWFDEAESALNTTHTQVEDNIAEVKERGQQNIQTAKDNLAAYERTLPSDPNGKQFTINDVKSLKTASDNYTKIKDSIAEGSPSIKDINIQASAVTIGDKTVPISQIENANKANEQMSTLLNNKMTTSQMRSDAGSLADMAKDQYSDAADKCAEAANEYARLSEAMKDKDEALSKEYAAKAEEYNKKSAEAQLRSSQYGKKSNAILPEKRQVRDILQKAKLMHREDDTSEDTASVAAAAADDAVAIANKSGNAANKAENSLNKRKNPSLDPNASAALDKVFNGSTLGATSGSLDSTENLFVKREYFKIPDAYKVSLTFTSLLPDNFNNFLYGFRGDNIDPVENYVKGGHTVDPSVFETMFQQLKTFMS